MAEKYNNIKYPIRDEWAWSLMKDVVSISSGKTPKGINDVKLKPENDIDFYKVSDMNAEGNEKYMVDSALKVTLSEASSLKLKLEEPNTIIFPKRGGAILTNKKRILSKKSAYDLNLMGVKEKSEIMENRFLWFWFQKLDLSRLYDGSNVPQINNKDIEPLLFPVAPLPEQRAIVSKIEQLFSDLDNGVENFKKAQEQLKIYRQAVLKNACEGKLVSTEAKLARAEGRDYEPADVLLERILVERREKWDGKGKYKEPVAPDTSGLAELPAGWCYTHIEMLLSTERTGIKTGPFGSLLKKHEHIIEGIPVLGIENIKAMKFIAGSKIHITKEKSTQLSSYDALPDDVLISRSGTVGEVCIVPEGLGESRISTNLMRISLAPNGMLPIFFTFLFNGSPYILDQVTDLCKGSTRNFLNRGILFSLIFTLPPLAEQRRIVTEVERRLSICDNMEATIAESLQKAESLRQSILKKAFEGKLLNERELEEVRNAPDWEPAEKLLERIKADKQIISKEK